MVAEPSPPDAQRALAAGADALAAGRWEQARAAFADALAGPGSPDDATTGAALDGLAEALWWLGEGEAAARLRERAYAAHRRAGDVAAAAWSGLMAALSQAADLGNGPAARGWAARVERLLGDDPGPLAGWLEALRGYLAEDPAEALAGAERGLALARAAGDLDLELVALADAGSVRVALGRTAEGLAEVDEAMAGALAGEGSRLDTVVFVCCSMLHACERAGDPVRAALWCREAERFGERYGCPFLYATCRMTYAGLLLAAGRFAPAERELEAALRCASGGSPGVRAAVLARLADLRVQQGRLEEAEALLRGLPAAEAALPAAALHLARGEPGAVAALLGDAGEGPVAGPGRLGDVPRALLLLTRAALALGDAVSAGRPAAALAAAAADGAPRVAALADLAAGEVAAARGDAAAAAESFRWAAARFDGLHAPLEAARARLALAAALAREDGDPAAAAVEARRAFDALQALGARPDADRAAAVLRGLGTPRPPAPRSPDPLTPRQREVLGLLRLGLSNAQIAERLVISRRTAAHHVSAVLGKLGVATRAQAAARADALS